ncbi:hypothetical protein OG244_24570 [Streptomyces brevispora]|uniref:hypothetical protein n=1 Tax=Streptomyces brevispora TaxID=887462 RepID=UPI002E35DA9F|nr:hypothetical protein [Streptomyces brevispora]
MTEELSDRDRAFEVWIYLANKAGWDVTEIFEESCGEESKPILIEGVRYQIRYGLRVRSMLADDSTGHLTHRPVLSYAAWVEPDLSMYELEHPAQAES